ncbi:MAG: hypothetical protein JSR77_04895 [Planctomycetes bacterium]|nr:hypothetical protein [Planctomycetota bacterium]
MARTRQRMRGACVIAIASFAAVVETADASTTLAISNTPFAPRNLVIVLAGLTFLLLLIHMRGLIRHPMPASRRRIRLANGALMLATTPVTAYALGFVSPAQTRPFTFAWVLVTGMVIIVIFMAMLDIFNNWRLGAKEHREMAGEILGRLPRMADRQRPPNDGEHGDGAASP